MKKFLSYFSLVAVLFSSLFVMTACGQKDIKVDVVIDNEVVSYVTTNSKKNYLLSQIPKKPDDITIDKKINKYFYGWFVDSDFQTPLSPTTKFKKDSKIFGKWIKPKTETFEYSVYKGEATITKCNNKNDTIIVVPDFLNSFPVVSIGENAFKNNNTLNKLFLPDSIKGIGNSAFFGCTVLTNMTISQNVTNIGHSAFCGCINLKSVVIDSPSIAQNGIGNSYLLDHAKELIIGDNVTRIGENSFAFCSRLTNIIVDVKNSVYKSINNCLLTKDGKNLILGCKTSIIPEGVITIGNSAFQYCAGLENIIIPDSVENIGNSAFCGCTGLISVDIGNGVKSIGGSAFSECSRLTYITIGKGVTYIDRSVFAYCYKIKNVIIDSVEIVESGVESSWLLEYAETVYIKDTINNVDSSITKKFTKQEISDKIGYNKYIKSV